MQISQELLTCALFMRLSRLKNSWINLLNGFVSKILLSTLMLSRLLRFLFGYRKDLP